MEPGTAVSTMAMFAIEGKQMQSCRPLAGVLLLVLALSGRSIAAAADGGAEARPALEILGAHATEGVKLALTGPDLKRELRLQSTTATRVDAVRVIVTPLRDSTGQLWDVSWDLAGRGKDTPVSVPSLGSVPLSLEARLPAAGSYIGEIFLLYGREPVRVRLTVTRGPAPLPVEVSGMEPVEATADPLGTSEAPLRFTVRETSGQELSLEPPSVVGLSQVARSAIQFQAPFKLKDAKALVLRGGTEKQVQLFVEGLEGAGEYKGTLRLSAPGMQPVEREFRVYLKEHWAVALFWVCLGVLASLLLRWVVQHFRPRLEIQHAVLLLHQELEQEAQALPQPLGDLERRVLVSVLTEMNRLVHQAGAGTVKVADAETWQARLEGKRNLFPVWAAVCLRVRDVRSPSIRKLFEERLRVAESRLTGTEVSPKALEESRTDLQSIPTEVDQKVRDELKEAVALLLNEVEAQQKDPGAPLGMQLGRDVTPDLEEARKLLGEGTAESEARARDLYERARRSYLRLLADDLASELTDTEPYGFKKAGWDDLRKRVLEELNRAREPELDLDTAFTRYTRAHHLYLQGAATALLDTVLSLLTKGADGSKEMDEKEKKEKKERLEKLEVKRAALEVVLKRIREDDLAAAARQYKDIQREVQELESTTRGNVTEKLIGGGTAALRQLLTAVGRRITISPASSPVSLGSVSRWRLGIDVGVSFFFALVAALMGVLALWANDLTWGGWTARVTAFFWGLGIHQATFTTISGLAEMLTGKKESP